MIGAISGSMTGDGFLAGRFALRACLLASAAGVSACASNPESPGAPSIEFRGSVPGARPVAAAPVVVAERPVVKQQPAPPAASVAPAPKLEEGIYQRVVDVGVSPTGTSAVEEAKAMQPVNGSRPGGALRQARDNPSARAIEVQKGDTLYDISRRYSVNMRALIETNAMEPPYALNEGDTVFLPPPNVHRVEAGETLYAVSRRYNVDTRSLALLNNMKRPWTVFPGDELMLPPLAREQARAVVKPVQAASPPVVTVKTPIPAAPVGVASAPKAPTIKPAASKIDDSKPISLTGDAGLSVKAEPKPETKVETPKVAPVPAPSAPPKSVTSGPAGGRDFIWPVSGNVLKGFGQGSDGTRNDGVNIAAQVGAEVRAAGGGEVVYAGSELAGFGNLILIRHPGGWVTAYAHTETMKVKEGDLVKQGQPIATAGQTGNASSPQVHFELRKGKEPVDPAQHLPPLRG